MNAPGTSTARADAVAASQEHKDEFEQRAVARGQAAGLAAIDAVPYVLTHMSSSVVNGEHDPGGAGADPRDHASTARSGTPSTRAARVHPHRIHAVRAEARLDAREDGFDGHEADESTASTRADPTPEVDGVRDAAIHPRYSKLQACVGQTGPGAMRGSVSNGMSEIPPNAPEAATDLLRDAVTPIRPVVPAAKLASVSRRRRGRGSRLALAAAAIGGTCLLALLLGLLNAAKSSQERPADAGHSPRIHEQADRSVPRPS